MKVFRNSILTIAATSLLATAAHAGGFSTEGVNPGGALFNDKSFVVQGALGYVMPKRKYSNGSGLAATGFPSFGSTSSDASNNYLLLSGDLKFRVNEEIDCALRAHEPYKADSETSSTWIGRVHQSSFKIDSLGLNASCSYKFDLGNGYRVRAIAGLISTDVSVKRTNETVLAPPPGLIIATNTYDAESDRGYGYRVGAAFEIPKYALRAQVIYDSKIDLDFTGTQTLPGHPFSGSAITASLELPQSVAARIQSGINDTTLVYAGVRWTEWSVIDQLDIIGGTSGVGGVNTLPFGYDNGWTVDVGVQKKLSKDLGGSLGVTWNSGIGNGFTDTWGFSAGLSYDLDDNWRISLGGSATLLTSSTESNGPASTGATSNYTQGDDWAYAAGLRLQYAID